MFDLHLRRHIVFPDQLRQGIGTELFAENFFNLLFVERGFALQSEQNLERVFRKRMLLKSGFTFVREAENFVVIFIDAAGKCGFDHLAPARVVIIRHPPGQSQQLFRNNGSAVGQVLNEFDFEIPFTVIRQADHVAGDSAGSEGGEHAGSDLNLSLKMLRDAVGELLLQGEIEHDLGVGRGRLWVFRC